MQFSQFQYTLHGNGTPFSVILGGVKNLGGISASTSKIKLLPANLHINWLLKDCYTNTEINVRQIFADKKKASSILVAEFPLQAGHVYETLRVSSPRNISFGQQVTEKKLKYSHGRMGFARGTHIMTSLGERRIETLTPGARLITRDHGMRTIRWIGKQKQILTGLTSPIIFTKGSLKNHRDLIVSADHRVVLKGTEALMQFGTSEVLVPARNMIDGNSIFQSESGVVSFYQILLDRHEVIYGEAAASESFMPDTCALAALNTVQRAEIFAVFPDLREKPKSYGPCARGFVESHAA